MLKAMQWNYGEINYNQLFSKMADQIGKLSMRPLLSQSALISVSCDRNGRTCRPKSVSTVGIPLPSAPGSGRRLGDRSPKFIFRATLRPLVLNYF
jgi:hypothetical protein